MAKLELFYATNRRHEGKDRWKPKRYGKDFSNDGRSNLRFGKLQVEADETRIGKYIAKNKGDIGVGDGEGLSDYLSKCAKKADIRAYREKLKNDLPDHLQPDKKLGSLAFFSDLKSIMDNKTDVLVYIHGFNVSWEEAVGGALALQLMVNRKAANDAGDPSQKIAVVLLSWPSDGSALPFVAYSSDRKDVEGSGFAFGRGLLKLRDFLRDLRDNSSEGNPDCGQDLHLLCHSMGNYLLENIIERMDDFTPGRNLSKLFDQIFLCAPDVDEKALEPGQALEKVPELARGNVTIYHNRGDTAMMIADYTKGHPERLGAGGVANHSSLHPKVHQVDCTPVVEGLVEHSYYLSGNVNIDIRQSMDGIQFDHPDRKRIRTNPTYNVWAME